MRAWMAGILAWAVCAGVAGAVEPAEENLLQNPGFEDGDFGAWTYFGQGWRVGSFVGESSRDMHDGKFGLLNEVAPTDGDEWRGAQQILRVKPNKHYTLGAWVRVAQVGRSQSYSRTPVPRQAEQRHRAGAVSGAHVRPGILLGLHRERRGAPGLALRGGPRRRPDAGQTRARYRVPHVRRFRVRGDEQEEERQRGEGEVMGGRTASAGLLSVAPGDVKWLGRKDRVVVTFLDKRAGLAVPPSCEPRLAAGFGIVQMLDPAQCKIGRRVLNDG